MDTLTLSIENHATLENGGPVTLTLVGKGAQIGRKRGNDWVLPDPSRHISGHHFDITFERGGYMLTDVSSNGVFLHGERYRLGGPHEIRDGDRFTVGQYIIKAVITAAAAAAPAPAPEAAPAPPPPAADPNAPMFAPPVEGSAQPSTPPVTPSPLQTAAPVSLPPSAVPPAAAGDEFDDIWGDLGGAATPAPSSGVQAPPSSQIIAPGSVPGASTPPDFSTLGGPSNLSMPPVPQPPQPPVPPATPTAEPAAPVVPPMADPPAPPAPPMAEPAPPPPPFPPQPSQPTQPPVPQAHTLGEGFSDPMPQQRPVSQPLPGGQGVGDIFLAAFMEAAGMDPTRVQIPPDELGRMMGQIARTGTNELMRMLQERTAVKVFVASEDRTMRVASGNNPMKFETDPERAFDMLFVEPRAGYNTGGEAFANALEDVRRHQAAVMASVQPALAEMLEGLSPPEIEEDSGGGMFSGGGRKAWEEFTKRWETRAAQGDNGMLDAFIKAFGRHYGDALRKL
ncbi:MAG: type VI secretion system-associated FHA domain protein TagH [Pseudomonadota bacterium]